MAAGFTIIRVLLLCWFSGVGFSSTFPTGRRFVYPKAWHVGRRSQQEVSAYRFRHPLQNFQSLRPYHRNLQPLVHVRTWQKPWGGFMRIPRRYQPNLYSQTLSPYQQQSRSVTKLPQEVPPPPGPRGFQFHQETPVLNVGKGSDLNDYSRYGPSSVHLESSVSVPSGSSSKGSTKDPTGAKNPHEVSKQRYHLGLHVPIPPTGSSKTGHFPQRPGSIVQKHYMDPTKVQSGSIQTGSDPFFFSSAGSVQQQKQLYEPVHTKNIDPRLLVLPGYPHQHTAPREQIKQTHQVPIKHPSPTLPMPNYPQHLAIDDGYYSSSKNPPKKYHGKGQASLPEQIKQTQYPIKHLSPTLKTPNYQHLDIDSSYYSFQINPAKKHYSEGQTASHEIKQAEHPIKHPSPSLPIPNYPQHLDEDIVPYKVQTNPAKKHYGKGQTAPHQIKQSEQHPIKRPSPSLPIPNYLQHLDEDIVPYNVQINPAKKHYGKGQTAPQQIKQSEQHPIKHPSPSLPIPNYPQQLNEDILYNVQVNPARKHYGKGQTAPEQIKQAEQHPIKPPSPTLPIPNYPQHLDEDKLYYNIHLNPVKKDYGKGQVTPTQQIKQAEQYPIKHPSPTLPIPIHPQHLSVDSDYYGFHINPAKKHYGKGQTAPQQIKQSEHPIKHPSPSLPIPNYPQHLNEDILYNVQVNPARKHYGKGQTAPEQIKQAEQHPIKPPSPTLPIPNYPQHLDEDKLYYNIHLNPVKKDYGKGQVTPTQQIKQAEQYPIKHPSPTLPIPIHPQHLSVDSDYYGFHINPAKKHYGKGQTAPQQIKQSEQHPIKHPSPSLPIPNYPQHLNEDILYNVQVNPARKHYGKGQTAPEQIKQAEQHPIKPPSPTLPIPNYSQHLDEDKLYYNVHLNPVKKDYGKSQAAPEQIKQAEQYPIKYPSPTLPIPIHPQHLNVDSDHYGFHINPAKKYKGKGPTASPDATNLHVSLHYEGLPGGHHHGQRYNEGETKHPVQLSNYNQFTPTKQIAASQHELPSSGLHHREVSVVTYGAGNGVQPGQNYEYSGGSSPQHVSGLLNFQYLLPEDDEFNIYDIKYSDWRPYGGKYPGQQMSNFYSIKI